MQPAEREPQAKADIAVYGATGFTGKLVAQYLAARYPPTSGIRFVLAGRDRGRLQAVAESLGMALPPELVVADSADPESMHRLAAAARVVVSTVGPYARYGEPLVSACAESGTDYCDLCGEVQWMRAMIDRYGVTAGRSGARLVMSCGFDSIPSDLGVALLQEAARERFGRPFASIQLLVRAIRGGASGGTYASMLNAIAEARSDRSVARILADPYALNPAGERSGPGPRDQRGSRYLKEPGFWTAPFVMSSINTRVVRRTNALLGYPFGHDFRYSEATITGKGLKGRLRAYAMSAGLGAFVLAASNPFLRERLVRPRLPSAGEGPSAEQRKNGYFNMLVIGTGDRGDTLRMRIAGDRDPGYGSTSKMLSESAVALACGEVDVAGGAWTPAAAFGTRFRTRLTDNAGVSFDIEG